MRRRLRLYLGFGIAAAWGIYTAFEVTHSHVPAGVRDGVLALAAVLAVAFVERELLLREFDRWHKDSTSKLEDVTRKGAEVFRDELVQSQRLTAAAASSGLTAIWPERRGAAVDEIKGAIRLAQRRVWLLGVAFADSLSLEDLLNSLAQRPQAAEPVDVRILLMDPLRAPAIYRTLLESTDATLSQIVNCERPSNLDPLFDQRHLPAFHRNLGVLKRRPDAERIVRFYESNPSCWLVLCDDAAYYEPYTFGVDEPAGGGVCMGALMPVFRFQALEGNSVFQLLEQHFRKLWLTSQTGLVHAEARLAHASEILARMFRPDQRGVWFRQIAGSLRAARERPPDFQQKIDARLVPRQRCRWTGEVRVKWSDDAGPGRHQAIATIRDFSESGFALELPPGAAVPPKGVAVEVSAENELGADSETPQYESWEVKRLLREAPIACSVRWAKVDAGAQIGLAIERVESDVSELLRPSPGLSSPGYQA